MPKVQRDESGPTLWSEQPGQAACFSEPFLRDARMAPACDAQMIQIDTIGCCCDTPP